MPLVLRGIGLESGILVQKFAVRQGSVGRCKHRPLQMFLGQYRIILSADTTSEVRPTTIILYSLKSPPSHLQFLITNY